MRYRKLPCVRKVQRNLNCVRCVQHNLNCTRCVEHDPPGLIQLRAVLLLQSVDPGGDPGGVAGHLCVQAGVTAAPSQCNSYPWLKTTQISFKWN